MTGRTSNTCLPTIPPPISGKCALSGKVSGHPVPVGLLEQTLRQMLGHDYPLPISWFRVNVIQDVVAKLWAFAFWESKRNREPGTDVRVLPLITPQLPILRRADVIRLSSHSRHHATTAFASTNGLRIGK